jgi:D-glycero-D-manno-heptose 1,7-bisphosphate phosphatase
MNKAVCIDRDGVINSDEGHYYIFKTKDFKINDGIIPSLKMLQDAGYLLIIISNQSGIAKGIYSRSDTDKVHDFLIKILKNEKINITEIYYCPHHPDQGRCICRKPDSLMLEKAIARFDIDVNKSYLIGDSERDIEAAVKAGLKGIKVDKNSNIYNVCLSIAGTR